MKRAERRARDRQDEEERLSRFEERCALLRGRGYRQKNCTVTVLAANVWGTAVILPFAAAAVLLFIFFTPPRAMFPSFVAADFFLLAVLLAASIPVHECLHALCWAAANRSFAGIRFGVLRTSLTPYCSCEAPMGRAAYLCGTLAPFVLLGIGFSLAAVTVGYTVMLVLGVFNLFSAGGDALVAAKLLTEGRGIFLDHPTQCGFYRFYKEKA